MMIKRTTYTALAVFMLGAASATPGFAQSVPPYGAPISIERAKQVAAAALAEMRKKGFEMTLTIVDSGSNLVYLERSNQAGIGTIDAALGKAKAASGIKTPTKAIEDMILHNNQSNPLAVPGAFPVEGGVPLVADGQVIGAIGVSGGMPADDGAIANTGAKAL
ncbi:heme-binding protein [Rhizobium leguminosarum bv. viciae]|uniref:GlcG/HbpS family heme-binding protein n=1 Tax=Rhizobium leguminosarum TaxID=384 RepID=UPI0014420E83|nr:heme-binding protein [Rhizobium leguminosarum]NKK88957.1 heme-binding protein [Rhizobium leguminosarum bv. viciae]